MKQKSQQQSFEIKVKFENGEHRTLMVRASELKIAISRALKRVPTAVSAEAAN